MVANILRIAVANVERLQKCAVTQKFVVDCFLLAIVHEELAQVRAILQKIFVD
jgi:hypothetical protein